ncbi:MAG: hypothetical protein KGL39_21490 [Patescibacteria group bacterium]|nr:hypothetical protein [Patescibacteria group bacterium]
MKTVEALLEIVSGGVIDIGVLTLAILNAGYGASSRKIELEEIRMYEFIDRPSKLNCFELRRKYNLSSYISQLKRQGLIERKGRLISITKRGLNKLSDLKRTKVKFPSFTKYPKKKAKFWTIVAFDVPEKERSKRSWLRGVLVSLGFVSVQKSFYIGKIGIPEDFIKDLHKLNLLPYVEILGITKKGTLRKTMSIS